MLQMVRSWGFLAGAYLLLWPCPPDVAAQEEVEGESFTCTHKAGIWSFRWLPERRLTEYDEEGLQVFRQRPAEIWVSYKAEDSRSSLWLSSPQHVEILGGESREYTDGKLSDMQRVLLSTFYEFDIDFPGGSWEQLGVLLQDLLTRAYESQRPAILDHVLPKTITIKIEPPGSPAARYPAIKAKGIVLQQLQRFGIRLDLQGEAGHPLQCLVLREDLSAVEIEGPELFSMEEFKPDDVLALLEMAWWEAGKGPLYLKAKYHPNTRTLVIQGTRGELDLARRVFASLNKCAPLPADDATGPKALENIGDKLDKIIRLLEKSAREK